jgi:hypothetical protein
MTTPAQPFVQRRRDRRVADMPKDELWRVFGLVDRRKAERRA